jgi:hypothetical protein
MAKQKPNNGISVIPAQKQPENESIFTDGRGVGEKMLGKLVRWKDGAIKVDAKRSFRGGVMVCSVYGYKSSAFITYGGKEMSERVLLHRVVLDRDTPREVVELTLDSLCNLVTIQCGVEVRRKKDTP